MLSQATQATQAFICFPFSLWIIQNIQQQHELQHVESSRIYIAWPTVTFGVNWSFIFDIDSGNLGAVKNPGGFLKPRCGHGWHVAAKCVEAKGLEKRDILRLPRITCWQFHKESLSYQIVAEMARYVLPMWKESRWSSETRGDVLQRALAQCFGHQIISNNIKWYNPTTFTMLVLLLVSSAWWSLLLHGLIMVHSSGP